MRKKTIKQALTKGVTKVPVVMQLEALECGAAVEPAGWYGSNDSCCGDVTYTHEPANVICLKIGAFMYIHWVDYDSKPSDGSHH